MIGDIGGKFLAQGLFENRVLEHLNLNKNNLEEYSGRLFALIFKDTEQRQGNTTLKYLNLEENQIEFTIKRQIKDSLKRNVENFNALQYPKLREERTKLIWEINRDSEPTRKQINKLKQDKKQIEEVIVDEEEDRQEERQHILGEKTKNEVIHDVQQEKLERLDKILKK